MRCKLVLCLTKEQLMEGESMPEAFVRSVMSLYEGAKKKKDNFISITSCISSAYILKYTMQLVIEGKIRRQNMYVYNIPECE